MQKVKTLLVVLFWVQITVGTGQITLPRLISDGAILQREVELKIWGWASPQEQIELTFNNHEYQTQADRQGNWFLTLPPQAPGGPHRMVLRGKNEIVLENILFGDVWLCSGQSNMELTMQRVKDTYPEEMAHAGNPLIRQFLVPDKYDFNREHPDLDGGAWTEVDPESIYNFSAVAYFFAKELFNRYRVPVGLINAALGGSPVEAWMSEDALQAFPEAYAEMQRFKDLNLIREIEEKDQKRQREWYAQLNRQDPGLTKGAEWYLEQTKDGDWKEMELPGFWADEGLGAVNGAVWFRKKIAVPPSMAGQEAKLWVGRIVDRDSVYVNGRFAGTTGYQYPPRKYTVDAGMLRTGENTLTVRVISEQGRGGFILDKPYFLAVGNDTIDLKGTWKFRLGTKMEPLASPTFVRWKPGGLYNRMIAPLLNYQIKGAIWYQGESNASDPEQYDKTFPALIRNWRAQWQLGDFPFLYVQLANFMEETDRPAESDWAALRQAQLNALALPNTGMAVAIDLGEWNDIHPLNKADVGKRLALQARKLAYGEADVTASGPLPERCKFGVKKVKIRFRHAGTGLAVKNGGPLHYFEISGDGKRFVPATAVLKKGAGVVVWNETVDHPAVVRYAWADNPRKANLYSGEGLPASPFQLEKGKPIGWRE